MNTGEAIDVELDLHTDQTPLSNLPFAGTRERACTVIELCETVVKVSAVLCV